MMRVIKQFIFSLMVSFVLVIAGSAQDRDRRPDPPKKEREVPVERDKGKREPDRNQDKRQDDKQRDRRRP